MFSMKSIFSRSLAALAFALASTVALAAPTYHVTIDTTTLGTDKAYFDFVYSSAGGAAPSMATLTGFSGDFGALIDRAGDSSGTIADGKVILGNSTSYNDIFQAITLGGLFNFDVSFDIGGTGPGSRFAVNLFDANQNAYVGVPENLVQFDISAGQADIVAPANGIGSVAAVSDVPEPSTLLSMVTGLGLLGAGLRRRVR